MGGPVQDWSVRIVLCASILLSAGVVHRANADLEERIPSEIPTGDLGPLPNGDVVRVASLGFERLVADLFWLRTVYYVGDERSHDAGYPAAPRLAELVTDVDPKFHTAYVLMNSVLTALSNEQEAAVKLLDKGIREHPTSWKLEFLQGFNRFMYTGEYHRAARHMERASELGGPAYLPLLTARLYHRAGDPDTAIAFVEARLQQAETEEVRDALERRRRDLVIVRDLSRIDSAVERYRGQSGVAPTALSDLVAAGLVPPGLRDPEGNPYALRDGRAFSKLDYDRLELHAEGGG